MEDGMKGMGGKVDMQHRLAWLSLLGAVILVAAGSALATESKGFTSTTVAKGPIDAIEVSSFFLNDKGKLWLSFLKTVGKSDANVVSNVWEPGGYTGWHTHPSYTLVIVTAGTLTQYQGDDRSCTPHVYTAGTVFVDRGGRHVHNVRNEGGVPAQVYAVGLVPAGQKALIDAEDPGNCPF
jgi:quercetin dioxygenase-like cupin family protein